MLIKYLGHAAFLIRNVEGIRIITDPYSPTQGIHYKPIDENADIVTVSHEHWDHNAVDLVGGNPVVIRKEGERSVRGITITGIPTFHDKEGGKERGENTVFVFDIDGLRLCHLGDLGHKLNKEQISLIGRVDICLIPVGGYFTIDVKEAKEVIESLNPKVVIPMHFKTSSLDFPIAGVEDFLKGTERVKRLGSSEYEIEKDKSPLEREVIVLKPAKSS
ncbi:MAG: MBL fold metallo-hydrolase [bacterium (Candidatus Stahlbacteria) CG08_land_8_20_14_0_20_40_26]|nr:MAG: MBL fold metallo-hydrolase [bacterium (Candidatus Stahlbacteria) CG23_combo_of_CG06-09_8_20_14_all_40_9]PIS25267.1 MAG: MBL fold metallo-hydrolase [bacterium (Candidatus Stahlbacteria) CG08_land_8_20_14_0_20_40_26]